MIYLLLFFLALYLLSRLGIPRPCDACGQIGNKCQAFRNRNGNEWKIKHGLV